MLIIDLNAAMRAPKLISYFCDTFQFILDQD